MGDIGTLILAGGLFLVLFFLKEKFKDSARKNVEPLESPCSPQSQKVVFKPFLKDENLKLPARKQSLSYQVEKRKKNPSFLRLSLKDKASLKQAFILSEVLKRVDKP